MVRENTITILKYRSWYGIITNHAIAYTNLPVSGIVSLNFIRLLRVVITPSVERRKRLEAIG